MRQLLFFNSRDNLLRLDVAHIAYFESDGNYTNIFTKNKLRVQVGLSLTRMETALSEQLREGASVFMRVGKRFIINREYIFSIDTARQRLCISDMQSFAYQLPIGKDALKKIKELLVSTRV